MRKVFLFSAVCSLLLVLSSCGAGGSKSEKKKVTIGMVDWLDCVANSHLTKVVLEENGYEVDIIRAGAAPVFAAVARGNADLFLDSWEPVSHQPYVERFGDKLDHIGVIYDEGQLGLIVPSYVDINSIEELDAHKEAFNGEFISVDPGAGIIKVANNVIEKYELDYEVRTSSEAGMVASLKKAYEKKEWIVLAAWKPHTMFAEFDLKLLKDPKMVMGKKESINIIATKGWKEKNPELITFFNNYKLDDALLGSLMIAVQKNPTKEDEACRQWYAQHKELVDSWFEKK